MVAQKTVVALDAVDGGGGTDWGMVFTTIGAVAYIASAAVASVTFGPVGWAMLGGVASMAAVAAAPAPDSDDTIDILLAMDNAVAALRATVDAEERILVDALNTDLGTAQSNRIPNLLPMRPVAVQKPPNLLDIFLPPSQFTE
jgi:hypothetical protein